MGRNNQHAGMHIKWWHGDRSQGDFNGYDRYVDMIAESKLRRMNPNDKKIVNDLTPITETPTSTEMHTSKSKKKKRKNQQNQLAIKEKKQLIPDKYFAASLDLYANIFTIAFEKRIDVFDYVCECEKLCAEDKYMCQTVPWLTLHPLEKSHIFLHMLADKIGCEIYEFFIMNEEIRQRRIYSILQNILKKYEQNIYLAVDFAQENDVDSEGNEYTVTCLTLSDYSFSNLSLNNKNDSHYYTMHYIHKIINNTTGDLIYSLNIKTSTNYKTKLTYMYERAEIYTESEGEMAEFFEKSLHLYLKSGETVGSCVTW